MTYRCYCSAYFYCPVCRFGRRIATSLLVCSLILNTATPLYAQAPPDRLAIVQQVVGAQPVDNTSEAAILKSVLRVIAALPPSERAGLLRKDGGENITPYAPAGVNVSISRVAYPNGDIAKIFSDAGPNGTNGPIWTLEGNVGADRYVPVVGDVPNEPNPGTPDPNPGMTDVLVYLDTIDKLSHLILQEARAEAAKQEEFRQKVGVEYGKFLKAVGKYGSLIAAGLLGGKYLFGGSAE